MTPAALESALSAETCERRVREAAGPDRGVLSDLAAQRQILVAATDHGLRIRVAIPPYGPRYYLRFKPTIAGTRVELRTSLHPYRTISMLVWLSGILGIGGYLIVASILRLVGIDTGILRPILGIVVPVMFFGFAALFVRRELAMIRDGNARVLSFLKRELEARDAGAPPNATGPRPAG